MSEPRLTALVSSVETARPPTITALDGANVAFLSESRTEIIVRQISSGDSQCFEGHKSRVTAVALRHGLLCSASCDAVNLWDLSDEQGGIQLAKDIGSVQCVAFSRSGARRVALAVIKDVRLFDTNGKDYVKVLRGHKSLVSSCIFGDDDSVVFSSCEDGSVAFQGSRPFCAGADDGKLFIMELRDNFIHLLRTINLRLDILRALGATDPAGDMSTPIISVGYAGSPKAVSSNACVVACSPQMLMSVSLGSFEVQYLCYFVKASIPRLAGACAFAMDEETAEVMCAVGSAFEQHLEVLKLFPTAAIEAEPQPEEEAREELTKGPALTMTPDSYNMFATIAIDGSAKLWDLRSVSCVRRFEGHSNRVHKVGVALSPCLRFVATGSENNATYVYDVTRGTVLSRIPGHSDVVSDVDFSLYRNQLVSCSHDGTDRAKVLKKRARFTDSSTGSAKRARSLLLIAELDDGPDSGNSPFFRENHRLVLATLTDITLSEKEARAVISVVNCVLRYNTEDARDERTNRVLASVLEKMLYLDNQHGVRMAALEAVIALCEVCPLPSPEDLRLITASLNFQACQYATGPQANLPPGYWSPERTALSPGSASSGRKETAEMLDKLLAAAARTPQALAFWAPFIRDTLLVLYPAAGVSSSSPLGAHLQALSHQTAGTVTNARGFTRGCPADLQIVVGRHVVRWLQSELLHQVMFSNPLNYALVLEVHRQCVVMPCSNLQAISALMKTVASFFVLQQRALPGLTQLNRCDLQKAILADTAAIFSAAAVDNPTEYIAASNAVLKGVYAPCVEAQATLEPEIRTALLQTLLRAAWNLLNPAVSNPNVSVLDAMKGSVMDALLTGWLRIGCTDKEMWEELYRTIEPLLFHQEVVRQIKAKLMHLTLAVKDTYRPLGPCTKEAPYKRRDRVIWSLDTKEAVQMSKDVSLNNAMWDGDTALTLWHYLLNVFRNAKSYSNPKAHEGALATIVEVLDAVLAAENTADLDLSDTPSRFPLITVFCPFLFESCSIEDMSKASGIAHAYAGLCHLLCRRFPALPRSLLSHFYTCIQQGLCTGDRSISWSIVTNSYNIFSLGLPGSFALIPYYVTRAKELLMSTMSPTGNPYARHKCLALVYSLLSFPSHYPELSLPCTIGDGKTMTAQTLRETVQSVVIATAHITHLPSECKCMSVWVMVVAICEELCHWNGQNVPDLAHALLSFIGNEDVAVARTALNAVSHIAAFGKFSSELAGTVVDALCTATMSQKTHEVLIPYVYLALSDWLVCGSDVLLSETTQQKLLLAIEYALMGKKKTPRRLLLLRRSVGGTQESDECSDSSASEEVEHKLTVKALHFRDVFPFEEGVDVWCSQVLETDDGGDEDSAPFWAVNSTSLMSITEVKSGAFSCGIRPARMILRDSVGRWAWDWVPVRAPQEVGFSESMSDTTDAGAPVEDGALDDSYVSRQRARTNTKFLASTNKLQGVLAGIEQEHPELAAWVPSLSNPDLVLDCLRDPVQEMMGAIDALGKSEAAITTPHSGHVQAGQLEIPTAVAPEGRVTTSRLLVQQLGLLSPIGQAPVERLAMSEKLSRSISALDKLPGRECHKIGLVYVAEGQEQQSEILANKEGSALYNDFTAALGWRVELATHRGYIGSMDRAGNAGKTTLYWANSNCEIVFHEVVSLPTSDTDTQQIKKKKHVGNDHVHIVWCENLRDYNPLVITSEFNDAHIVIYPLPSGLFRIQIFRDSQMPLKWPDDLRLVEQLRPGAVTLTCRLFQTTTLGYDPKSLRSLTDALHALPTPPLVALDHELGPHLQLLRDKPPGVAESGFAEALPELAAAKRFTVWPTLHDLHQRSASLWASRVEAKPRPDDDDAAFERTLAWRVGRAAGLELRAVGIDATWAPVVDVARRGYHYEAIGRALMSDDVEGACAVARALALGVQSAGVAACPKHFPGMGAARDDSHFAVPSVPVSADELRRVDLAVFRASVRGPAGAMCVMTNHALYPAVDPSSVATTSAAFMGRGGLLRAQPVLFDGVAVTDDLGMAGVVQPHGDTSNAAVQALNAGCDMLMFCFHAEQRAESALAAIAQHAAAGRVAEAAARVSHLRQRLADAQSTVACGLEVVGCDEHARLAVDAGYTDQDSLPHSERQEFEEHARRIWHMQRRMAEYAAGPPMRERRKNPMDPLAHPTYIMRTDDQLLRLALERPATAGPRSTTRTKALSQWVSREMVWDGSAVFPQVTRRLSVGEGPWVPGGTFVGGSAASEGSATPKSRKSSSFRSTQSATSSASASPRSARSTPSRGRTPRIDEAAQEALRQQEEAQLRQEEQRARERRAEGERRRFKRFVLQRILEQRAADPRRMDEVFVASIAAHPGMEPEVAAAVCREIAAEIAPPPRPRSSASASAAATPTPPPDVEQPRASEGGAEVSRNVGEEMFAVHTASEAAEGDAEHGGEGVERGDDVDLEGLEELGDLGDELDEAGVKEITAELADAKLDDLPDDILA
eukprot:m51a1_g3498 hypothetical protein (2478) ;mRNA; f:817008-829256